MTLPLLTVIPAGAGSGKTYTLKARLGQWVVDQVVAPERILAVTFTEAAAAELRERIRAELLDRGRNDDALRLDQAYISTIHGFGLRVLTEFAFEAGVSPHPRLLNDDEQDALLRKALARTDKTDPITADLAAYGYCYDYNSGRSAEAMFREDLLQVVRLLRAIGSGTAAGTHVQWATDWLRNHYGPTVEAAPLRRALQRSVEALLAAFPDSLERDFGNNETARKQFQSDYRNLRRARDTTALSTDWSLWQGLRQLRRSNRSITLPEAYDALAAAVIAAADALPRHPGPLEQAIRHITLLIEAGLDVLEHDAQARREAGLVDYDDMIGMAGQLLRDRPDVLATLKRRIDCLVVDEFQDTNPLQFDLLWQLHAAGVPTVVVGDLKQAIMGFQGADPRLFEALIAKHASQLQPLTSNWRSQPRLMAVVNAIGAGLFGEDYVALAPQGADSPLPPLDVIRFPERAKKDKHAVRAAAVGARIAAWLHDPERQLSDARTGQLRRLRGGDVAVLCPTHGMLSTYATVLRAQGLRVRLEAKGWFASRPVQIAWHALAYLANPNDSHAALYLAVTELGSHSLESALRQRIELGRIDDPLLTRLDALAEHVAQRSVDALIAETLDALGLFNTVACWPTAEQDRANLLRLLAEATAFMDATPEALAQAGFHGSGVETFLAWLAARVEADDAQPDPRVIDEDAVVLATWHSAKGREWPMVAVCGLDRPVKPREPSVALDYPSFDDLSALLATARIAYSPVFDAPETRQRFQDVLLAEQRKEARRLLYVALTRARDTLLLEWPEYLTSSRKTTLWSLLSDGGRIHVTADALHVGTATFPCAVTTAAAMLPDDLAVDATVGDDSLPIVGRRAIEPQTFAGTLTPDSRSPSASAEAVVSSVTALHCERVGAGLHEMAELSGAALGSFLHRSFEILGARPALLERLPEITGVTIPSAALTALASAVNDFDTWLKQRFPGATLLREWPVLACDQRGSVVSGTADLIVQTADGVWIIDHKSDRTDDPVAGFAAYQPQLQAYAEALAGEGSDVQGIAIHWIRRGEVVLQALVEEG